MFFDISGFLHGINFLVLAIGVYGIGEMLWTLDSTRGKIISSEAKMTVKGIVEDSKEGMRRVLEGYSNRLISWVFRRDLARSRCNTWLVDVIRRRQNDCQKTGRVR